MLLASCNILNSPDSLFISLFISSQTDVFTLFWEISRLMTEELHFAG